MVTFSVQEELIRAFGQESVPSLSSDPVIRGRQDSLIARITATINENYQVLGILQELKEKSAVHGYHSLRVGVTFLDLVLREEEKEVVRHVSPHTLSIAGVLHDGGKTCVYDDILKGGDLDPRERRIMNAHN